MNVFNVYPLYKRRTLVSRESAGALRDVIFEAVSDSPVALDLSGIRAITPAFIDQMLLIVEESLGEDSDRLDVLLLNPPPRNGQQAPTHRPGPSSERGRGGEGQLGDPWNALGIRVHEP